MFSTFIDYVNSFSKNKDLLTLWINNLLVLYSFLLPISQTIKATIFSFMIILFIVRGDIIKYLKEALSNKVVRSFVYLFIIYVIGMLWTENIEEGLSAIKNIKYGLYLIIFYVIVDGRYIDKVIGAFILGMLVSELTSYAMMLGIMPWKLELWGILFYHTQRVGDPSPFLNHIHYGVALAFVVIILLQKVFFGNASKVAKILMFFFSITATVNIFITGGRTGYMTFLFLIVVLSIFYLRKWALVFLVAMSLIFITAYSFSPLFKAKMIQSEKNINLLLEKNPNFNTPLGARVGIAYYFTKILNKHPIIGVGTGDAMDEMYKATPKKYYMIHSLEHLHNQYLHIFLSLGFVGFLIYLNIFYNIFKYKNDEKDLKFIMIFSTLAIAFGTMTTEFNLRFLLPLWVVMLAVTLINRDRKTIENIKLNDKTQAMQIIIAGAFFSISSLLYQLM